MNDNVVSIGGGPQQVLRKHLEAQPELAVCLSIKQGMCSVDFSAPFTLGDLLLLHRLMGAEIDRVIFQNKRE